MSPAGASLHLLLHYELFFKRRDSLSIRKTCSYIFYLKWVFGSHVSWNSVVPDPNVWCCILLFLVLMSCIKLGIVWLYALLLEIYKLQCGFFNLFFCFVTKNGISQPLVLCNGRLVTSIQSSLNLHYRKRGSASYIVREVCSVRERDTERERERERESETEVTTSK